MPGKKSPERLAELVVIECTEPRQLNEVLFEVKGRARTYWTASRKTCSANEAYFCEQFNTTYTHKLPKNDAAAEEGDDRTGRRRNTKSDTRHLVGIFNEFLN